MYTEAQRPLRWSSFKEKDPEIMFDLFTKPQRDLDFMNPPIKLQNQFAERVQIIENQKQQAQESLQKSEDLFNSLLQKAFKAELVK